MPIPGSLAPWQGTHVVGHHRQCGTSTCLDLPREWIPRAAQEAFPAGHLGLPHKAFQCWVLAPNKLAAVGTTGGISLRRGLGSFQYDLTLPGVSESFAAS